MNDWNPVEHQLRSWTPRSPSARLKARLFPGEQDAVLESPSPFGGRWAWLAPVTGCFMALMVVTSTRHPQLGYWQDTRGTDWLAAVTSNQSYAAYLAADFHSEQNAPNNSPIEWTNGAKRTGEPVAVLPAVTNSIIR